MKKNTKGNILLLITALIWGFAFVAQTSAMDSVRPFTFLGVRFAIGSIILVPVIFIDRRIKIKKGIDVSAEADNRKILLVGGVMCGLALFGGSFLQQLGIDNGADTGKAGFLTALYILIVPVFGLFLRKKVGVKIWLCVIAAMIGIYFLSVKEGFSIGKADLLLVGCAVVFSVQIMFVDYFAPKVNPIKLSAIQFAVVSLIGLVFGIIFEKPQLGDLLNAAGPILFAGVLSSGVGYTLQVVAQKYTTPAEASLIMSLESAFALLGGIIILHQRPQAREYIGMAIMFASIMISQIDFGRRVKK